jgi:hypothetical protein
MVDNEEALQCRFKRAPNKPARNPHMKGSTSLLRLIFGLGLGIRLISATTSSWRTAAAMARKEIGCRPVSISNPGLSGTRNDLRVGRIKPRRTLGILANGSGKRANVVKGR